MEEDIMAANAILGPTPKSADTEAEPSGPFTPGPWYRSGMRQKVGGSDTHSVVAMVDGKEIIVASVWYNPQTHEGFHDAGLMAAALDLLAVARAVRDASDSAGFSGPLGNLARAAIAKAEGK